jgi:hypothetical protein
VHSRVRPTATSACCTCSMHAHEVDAEIAPWERHLSRRAGRARGISLYLQLDRSRRLHD